MKNSIYFITLLLVSLFNSALVLAEEQTRQVESFTKVEFGISGKLFIEQGEKQTVRIIAEPSTLEEIVTEVKSGTLQIKFENNFNFGRWNPGKIEVYITVPKIEGLSLSGSGNVISKSIETNEMILKISGSGNIAVDKLNADNLKTSISGSGSILVKEGQSNGVDAAISGSGNIDVGGLNAKDVNIKISGSGNCSVNASNTLNVRASGSGNVYYTGNPSIDSNISGSGKLKKK